MLMYFKKYKDTNNGVDWSYNQSTCLGIDNKFSRISINLPERKILDYSVYGQGNVVIPTYFFDNRQIELEFRFKAESSQLFTINRDRLLIDWLYSIDDIYLVRSTENGLQIIRGFFKLNSKERYKSYIISDTIEAEFITELPFFEKPTYTIQSSVETTSYIFNLQNNGMFTPFIIEIVPLSGNVSYVKLEYGDSGLSNITDSFTMTNLTISQNSLFSVDFVTFKFSVDGVDFIPTFAGNTFYIKSGSSALRVSVQPVGTQCLFRIKYKERYI